MRCKGGLNYLEAIQFKEYHTLLGGGDDARFQLFFSQLPTSLSDSLAMFTAAALSIRLKLIMSTFDST